MRLSIVLLLPALVAASPIPADDAGENMALTPKDPMESMEPLPPSLPAPVPGPTPSMPKTPAAPVAMAPTATLRAPVPMGMMMGLSLPMGPSTVDDENVALKGVIDDLVVGAQHILEGAQKVAHEIAHGVDVAAHEAIIGLHNAVHNADQFIHSNIPAPVVVPLPSLTPQHPLVETPAAHTVAAGSVPTSPTSPGAVLAASTAA